MSASQAVRYATYHGNTEHMVGNAYGPNTIGEWLTAVWAEYQPETDTTSVGFAYGVIGGAFPEECNPVRRQTAVPR